MDNKSGVKIKNLREKTGMTQTDLAEKVGVSKALISAYEKGIRNPSYKVLTSIAEIFGVSVASFYERAYWEHEAVTVNITDLNPEQQKIIFSLINEFRKANQES